MKNIVVKSVRRRKRRKRKKRGDVTIMHVSSAIDYDTKHSPNRRVVSSKWVDNDDL